MMVVMVVGLVIPREVHGVVDLEVVGEQARVHERTAATT